MRPWTRPLWTETRGTWSRWLWLWRTGAGRQPGLIASSTTGVCVCVIVLWVSVIVLCCCFQTASIPINSMVTASRMWGFAAVLWCYIIIMWPEYLFYFSQVWSPHASASPGLPLPGCLSFLQVGVFTFTAPRDRTGLLQRLSSPCAFLFDQGVGVEEGAGFHTLCGGLSGCGRSAGASMHAGWHYQDGVQGNSLDVPLWCCECMDHNLHTQIISHVITCCMFILFWLFFSSTGAVFQGSNERWRNNPQWTQKKIHWHLNWGFLFITFCKMAKNVICNSYALMLYIVLLLM